MMEGRMRRWRRRMKRWEVGSEPLMGYNESIVIGLSMMTSRLPVKRERERESCNGFKEKKGLKGRKKKRTWIWY